MSRRLKVGFIYFGVVLMALLLRISSALDVYSALGIEDSDAFFTCIVQLLIFGAMSVCLYLLTVTRYEGGGIRNFLSDFGFKKISGRNVLRTLVLTFCMIVVTSAFSYVWQFVLVLIGFTHIPSSTDYSSVAVLFKELALTALLPGIFEEVAHRGLIYAGYKETGWKFVIVSALFFSLMHQNIVQTGYTFLDGVMIALAMYYTGSIFPGMMMHIINNAWAVFEGYIAQNGGAFDFVNVIEKFLVSSVAGSAVSIVAVIVCSGLTVLVLFLMRKDAVKAGTIPNVPFYSSSEEVLAEGRGAARVKPFKEDMPFIATVVVGVVAAIMSFVWGMLR